PTRTTMFVYRALARIVRASLGMSALLTERVDTVDQPTPKNSLGFKPQNNIRAHVWRQPHPIANQKGQNDQPELVKGAEGTEGLDGSRSADQVDVAAAVRSADLLQQQRRVAVNDDMVGRAGRTVRAEHEDVKVRPGPGTCGQGRLECGSAHEDGIKNPLEFNKAVALRTEARIHELDRSAFLCGHAA